MRRNRTQTRAAVVTRSALSAQAVVIYVFFYAPIILLFIFSFSNSRNPGVWGGFTLDWYAEFVEHTTLQKSLWVSVRVALLSTVVSVVLGTLARWRSSGSSSGGGGCSTRCYTFPSSCPTSPWP